MKKQNPTKPDIYFLIKRMRELRAYYRFTHYEQLLFYEVLAMSDNQDSNTPILCSNESLCAILNIDVKTLRRARNRLCKANLIIYNAGRGRRNIGQYTLPYPSSFPSPFSPSILSVPDAELNGVPLPKNGRKTPTIPPAFREVETYCRERQNGINPQHFIDHYTARGWMIGKNKMKDWRAAIRTWEQYNKRNENRSDNSKPKDYTKGF